jgi:hypothetical protein
MKRVELQLTGSLLGWQPQLAPFTTLVAIYGHDVVLNPSDSM